MSDQFGRPKDAPMWLIWTLVLSLCFGVPLIGLFVAIVKFIAWWKIAFVL